MSPRAEHTSPPWNLETVEDLGEIALRVGFYWNNHARLPVSLEELLSEPGGNVPITDPASDVPYEYRPLEGATYELCAQFERESQQRDQDRRPNIWPHGSGRHCFRREVRKSD